MKMIRRNFDIKKTQAVHGKWKVVDLASTEYCGPLSDRDAFEIDGQHTFKTKKAAQAALQGHIKKEITLNFIDRAKSKEDTTAEWYFLFGLITFSFSVSDIDHASWILLNNMIDLVAVAQHIDEMKKEMVESWTSKKASPVSAEPPSKQAGSGGDRP
jgi:hypothetical protein